MNKESVFVHVPKTGGASIMQICIRHQIRVIDHNLRNPYYISLQQYKHLNPDIYSFAIVRNPWDRVVSAYNFLKKGGLNKEDREDAEKYISRFDNFRLFVLEGFQDDRILDQIHFRPQYKWISNEDEIIVDLVGRFEELQISTSRWLRSINLPNYKLPHVNKGDHKPYKQYYDDKTIETVRSVYQKDIALFKYTF